jgi:aminoglycoside phosphotransferase family enzyme
MESGFVGYQYGDRSLNFQDQTETITFLSKRTTFGVATPVEVIETHISRIFLAGDRAFKMKRVVKLPYVDFSTPELRLAACRKEVELNSATAPDLYIGVRRITRQPRAASCSTARGN